MKLQDGHVVSNLSPDPPSASTWMKIKCHFCLNHTFSPSRPSNSCWFRSITWAAGASLSRSRQSFICIWARPGSQASSLLLIPTAALCGRASGTREGFYPEGPPATWKGDMDPADSTLVWNKKEKKKILHNRHRNTDEWTTGQCV